MKHSNLIRWLLLPAIVLIACLNWYCKPSAAPVNTERTTYAGLSDSAEYVGMQTCSGCHANVHSTFIHTGMGLSFDHASKTKSSANFSNHPLVYDKYKDFYYTPYWDHDSLKFKEFRLEGRDTVYQRVQTVKYIVGSGQHTNSHMWESNGYLFQAPMTFYTQKGKWDLPPGFENGNNSRFNRIIGLECMSCHNGYPTFVEGSENKFSLVKNGIDCERCHGPGSIHVKEKSMGMLIDTSKYIDYSIVNPAKLPIDLQFDVCQRCHIQGNAILNEGKSFFDFKPGMHLSDVMNVFMPVYEGRSQEHIMASHAERLKLSKCYIETMKKVDASMTDKNRPLKPYKDALTCITCHNPHVSVKNTNSNIFNAVCVNCHKSNEQKVCSADKNMLAKENNNCVSCHMQLSGAIDIPHVGVHDHKISIPVIEINKEAIKKFVGINAINNPNPPREAIAQAYINYFEKFGMGKEMLDSALKYIPVNSADDKPKSLPKVVQVFFLKKDYPAVIRYVESVPNAQALLKKKQYDNYYAWTCYRIGESYSQLGNSSAAMQWYAQANQLAPLSAEFSNKYGNVLASSGNIKEAKRIFLASVNEHPEYAPAYSNLGYLILSSEGNIPKALELYNQALALDPDYEQGLLNMAGVLAVQKNYDGATKYLKRVLKKNPENAQAKAAMIQLSKMK